MRNQMFYMLFALLSFSITDAMADIGQLTPPDLTQTIKVHPSPVPVKSAEPAKLIPEKTTTLVGILKKDRMAVGGESTGWSLNYRDVARNHVIEVDFERDIVGKAHDGATVRVTGKLVVREYVERGNVQTLVIFKLEEVEAPQ